MKFAFENDDLFKLASLNEISFPEIVCEKITDWIFGAKNILFFSGNPGIGKTYFCYAWAKYICHLYRNISELNEYPIEFSFFKSEQFFSYLREGIKEKKSFNSEIVRLCDQHYFILDDIGSTLNTEWEKKCFYSFLECRLQTQKPTLITSNHFFEESSLFYLSEHPSLEDIYDEKIISRLKDKHNTLIEMIGEDRRT